MARATSPFTPRTRFQQQYHARKTELDRDRSEEGYGPLCVPPPPLPDYLRDALRASETGRLRVRLAGGLGIINGVLDAAGYSEFEDREPLAVAHLRLRRELTFVRWAWNTHRAAARLAAHAHTIRACC